MRRALALALALAVAAPLTPALAADPAAPDIRPVPVRTPAPVETPAPPAEPTSAPEPSDAPAPSDAPDPSEPAPPPTPDQPTPAPDAPAPTVEPGGVGDTPPAADPALDDQWIVVLKPGADTSRASARAKGLGIRADREFKHAFRGYAATLTRGQLAALRADPAVAAVVHDDVISIQAQSVPTGVRRVFGPKSPITRVNGVDERVDADVAIVDTGIDPLHPDLNVVGGVNCSTADRTAWRDENGHGTHVAGTVGALDNGIGVVGVAPGVRLWAVRILDSGGSGKLSWYVCGLDWIAAMRDPSDSSRPLFEAVNMSVAKSGSDDGNCGNTNNDILHKAICRLVASGVTVVAAAGNNSFNAAKLVPASYNEVITVSALADTDGKPGALGGNLCYSWGSYDKDDTFANFSNYGGDVDLIAPGKCIWSTKRNNSYGYSSGTSMATPHVTGAVALYKSTHPLATPVEVKQALQALGNLGWKTGTDPDAYHERLLDVGGIGPLGDFSLQAGTASALVSEAGGTVTIPITVVRDPYFVEKVTLTADPHHRVSAVLSATSLFGISATSSTLRVTVPPATPTGTYDIVVTGTNWGRQRRVTAQVVVEGDRPVVRPPRVGADVGETFGTTSFVAQGLWPAATDPSSPIARYQAQWSVDGGAWGTLITLPASRRSTSRTFVIGHQYALRVRAMDTAGNWSDWATAAPFTASIIQDSSSALARGGTWTRYVHSQMSGGSTRYATRKGYWIGRTFTGRGVAVVVPKSPIRGKAQVWIDGKLVKTVDTYRRTFAPRRVVFSYTWEASGTHTVKVVVLGTSGRPRVDFDALVIVN
ncbi:MAG: S8 family serine peptidase [Chloroflexota bacterium]